MYTHKLFTLSLFTPTHPHTLHQQDFLLTRIPRETIVIDSSVTDPALGAATLEVGLNNPILEAGFEIICSPTSEINSLDAIKKTLQVCQVELHPFFVYGHDGKAPLNSLVCVYVCVCMLYVDVNVHQYLSLNGWQWLLVPLTTVVRVCLSVCLLLFMLKVNHFCF